MKKFYRPTFKTFNRFTKLQFVSMYLSRFPVADNETADDFIELLARADHAYAEYSDKVDLIRNEEFGRTFTRDQEYD